MFLTQENVYLFSSEGSHCNEYIYISFQERQGRWVRDQFPRAAVAKYCKLGGLRQLEMCSFTSLKARSSKPRPCSHCSLQGGILRSLLQLLVAPGHPWHPLASSFITLISASTFKWPSSWCVCISVLFSFYKDSSPVLPHLDLITSAKTLFQVTSHSEVLSRYGFFFVCTTWPVGSQFPDKDQICTPCTGNAEWVDVNFGGDTVRLSRGWSQR